MHDLEDESVWGVRPETEGYEEIKKSSLAQIDRIKGNWQDQRGRIHVSKELAVGEKTARAKGKKPKKANG